MSSVVSGLVKSTLSRVVSSTTKDSIDYTLGPRVDGFEGCSALWSLYEGTFKTDGSRVSVFVSRRSLDLFPLALNAYKKARTIRHPDLLKFISGKEFPDHVHIVTEYVRPLMAVHERDDNLKLWGCYKIATTLKFLNGNGGLVHGNVSADSIFVTEAGEWKLGALELMSSVDEENPTIISYARLIHRNAQATDPPEVSRAGWTVIKTLPPGTTDAWQYAYFVSSVYNGTQSGIDLRSGPGKIPNALYKGILQLLVPADKRLSISDFISNGLLHPSAAWFQNPFIEANLFLENIAIKDISEKESFFRGLEKDVDAFPVAFRNNRILPQLLQAVEYGAASPKVLSLIMKIGQSVDNRKPIVNVVIKLFSNQDRAIRFGLLENLQPIIDWLADKRTINDKIFPQLLTGFQDTVPQLREETLKGCLKLAPKLSSRNVNTELMKHLVSLQSDTDANVRTNATICIGKITDFLSESSRKRYLIQCYGTAIRDNFAPARCAALQALEATQKVFGVEDIATRIVPGVAPLCLDRDRNVRDNAIKCMNVFVALLSTQAAELPAVDTLQIRDEPQNSVAQVAGQVASQVTQNVANWGAWKSVSSYTKTLWPGVNEHPSTPSPPSPHAPNSESKLSTTSPTRERSFAQSSPSLVDSTRATTRASGSRNELIADSNNTKRGIDEVPRLSTIPAVSDPTARLGANANTRPASLAALEIKHNPANGSLTTDPFAELAAWAPTGGTQSSLRPKTKVAAAAQQAKPPPGYSGNLSSILLPMSSSLSSANQSSKPVTGVWDNSGWDNDDWDSSDNKGKPKRSAEAPRPNLLEDDDEWDPF